MAINFAKEKHSKQKYGNNKPYIFHLIGTAKIVDEVYNKYFKNDFLYETMIISALLHDVIEDTEITKSDVLKLFGFCVADTVALVTHNKGDSYLEYILQIRGLLASVVKFADLTFNINQSEIELKSKYDSYKKQRLEKYLLARYIINEEIKKYTDKTEEKSNL